MVALGREERSMSSRGEEDDAKRAIRGEECVEVEREEQRRLDVDCVR